MSHGPLMLDLAGTSLSPLEREMLQHPAAGGVILFSRNYESPRQIAELIGQIHQARRPSLLVAVDQEGGRVQRFREGFIRLPPPAWLGVRYAAQPIQGKRDAELIGWLMAAELRAVGVDFSFAPVLDIDRGISEVIGDRALHASPQAVADLGCAWMRGVHQAGMAAVGKHFPGHGGVSEDSHLALPVDRREVELLLEQDLLPFRRLIDNGLEAIMPAHVVYERAAPELAGFSRFWLAEVLRGQLGFQGVIFSDDLSMNAAHEAGGYGERAALALEAGCDMVLVCNDPQGAAEVLQSLEACSDPVSQMRLIRMHGRRSYRRDQLHLEPKWAEALALVAEFEGNPSLDLNFS